MKTFKTAPGLPEIAFALVEPENKIVIIKRGELGYYDYPPQALIPASLKQAAVDALNARFRVSKAQAEAMMAGSMFGWDAPAANPVLHSSAPLTNN